MCPHRVSVTQSGNGLIPAIDIGPLCDGSDPVCVTHEMGFARKLADTVVFMDGGRVIERAPPNELFKHPESGRAKTFPSQILAHRRRQTFRPSPQAPPCQTI